MSEAPSLPRGVINLFSEFGAEGSKHLVASPAVPVISFTGSTATGRAISAVGAQYLKRFGLELGGKTRTSSFRRCQYRCGTAGAREITHCIRWPVLHDRIASVGTTSGSE